MKVKLHLMLFIFSAVPPAEGGEVIQFDDHWLKRSFCYVLWCTLVVSVYGEGAGMQLQWSQLAVVGLKWS